MRKAEQYGPGGSGGRDAEIPLVREFLDSFADTAVVADAGGIEDGYPCVMQQYPDGRRFAKVDVYDMRPMRPNAAVWSNLTFRHVNMVSADFAHSAEKYDAITCVSVLEHTHCNVYGAPGAPGYDKVVLDHLVCKLAPRGRLLVTIPATAQPIECGWWVHSYGVAEVGMLRLVAGLLAAAVSVRWFAANTEWQWYEMSEEEFKQNATGQIAGMSSIAELIFERRADA